MKVENMPMGKIKPYANNPKIHPDKQVEHIANSLKEFGWKQPLVVDKDNVCVAGHGRLQAAKKLKMKEVPVVLAGDLTDEQIRAYRLADNKTSESGGAAWDDSLLEWELDNIDLDNMELDMSDFGFDISVFEDSEADDLKEMEVDKIQNYYYLIRCDLNLHDKLVPLIGQIRELGHEIIEGGVSVDSSFK